jgi:hypothetical protein
MHWHLILEEYGPELLYIKGEKNIVTNALSRLPIAPSSSDTDINYLTDYFGLHDSDLLDNIYLLQFQLIQKCKTDKTLQKSNKRLLTII